MKNVRNNALTDNMNTKHLSLRRGLEILEYLSRNECLGFSELKNKTGLPDNSLSRLLTTLAELGYLEHQFSSYVRCRNLSMDSVINIAHKELVEKKKSFISLEVKKLAHKTGLSCGAMIQIGEMTMKIFATENMMANSSLNRQRIPYNFNYRGFEIPMVPYHGFAQVFLAWRDKLSQKKAAALPLWQNWHRSFPADEYEEKFSIIRKRGYTVEDREQFEHMVRICVPVFMQGVKNPLVVIGLIGPEHLCEQEKILVSYLKKTGKKIENQLNQ